MNMRYHRILTSLFSLHGTLGRPEMARSRLTVTVGGEATFLHAFDKRAIVLDAQCWALLMGGSYSSTYVLCPSIYREIQDSG